MKAYSIHSLIALAGILCIGITAAATFAPPLTPIQQLYILKEIKPDAQRVGIVWRENSPNHDDLMPKVQRASAASGVQVFVAYVQGIRDVAPSYRTLREEHDVDVIWVIEDGDVVGASVAQNYLIRTATRDGVPILAPSSAWVDAGAPISLQSVSGNIQLVVNKAAAAATSLNVPEKYDTQYLTSR